jgi:protein ImuB
MLWACLHFSDLPLHAAFDADELAAPCAVVDGPRQRQHIVLANARARHGGVRAGRVLAASRAVCATLLARPRDRSAERRLLLSLAAWAYRFSSQVSLADPDALLIEVGASLRLFGGWPALERRLRRGLAGIGHAPAIAVAPIAAAARVLAAQHDGFFTDQRGPMLAALGCVPVAHSGLAADAVALLCNVGARSLRDAFALPRPELARRTGPAALALLDRLRGDDREPLPLYQPPDRFEHRVELEHRVEAWPPLLFPLRRLCNELAVFLAARDGGVQRCELVLDIEDKPAAHITIELLAPQREAHMLYDLVRSRLERVALAGPVCGIALVARDLPEFRPRHQDLFEPQRAQGLEWPELAERLRAHLGDESVRRLAAAADHRPELAWRFAAADLAATTLSRQHGKSRAAPARRASPAAAPEAVRGAAPVQDSSAQAAIPGSAPVRHPASASAAARDAVHGIAPARQLRPLWLLPRALPLRGPPPRILAGPERIESGWWDGGDTRRDYYVVQTRNGQRAWAFLMPGARDGWMLHGWFA